MTELPSTTNYLPDEVTYGFVADRIILSVGDTRYDGDRFPDGVPANGVVRFTPARTQFYTKEEPATILPQEIRCTIYNRNHPVALENGYESNLAGKLVDPAGHVGSVALVVGRYYVTYQLDTGQPHRVTIDVKPTHTNAKPLWIPEEAELIPAPLERFVVNERVYRETLEARDEVLDILRNMGISGVVFHTAALTESSDLNTIPQGHHRVTNTVVSAALGLPLGLPGTLLKTDVLSSGAATFLWQTRGSAGQVSRVFTSQLNGTTRSDWKELGSGEPEALRSDTVLDSLSTGLYLVTNRIVANDLGMPVGAPGSLWHITLGNGWLETFTTIDLDPVESVTYRRAKALNGVIQPWRQVATSGGSEAGGDSSGPVRRELLQQGLTARKGGRIGTNGKGVIALRFDDYHQEFREKVLPLLKERGLPFTRVSTSETIHAEVIPESELTAMQTYSIDAGGEVWNHGRDHGNATGEAAIYDNLIGALDTLRAKLPRIPIDCFAPPGGAVTFDGYMPSNEISNYADTLAGQQLFGHHALVSGYFQDAYYWPLDGKLKDGLNHYSADNFPLSRPMQYIGWARDWRVGIVLMWHSRPFDTEGSMSLADFTTFLDALVTARDAGEIEVLTVSGMAVADKGSSSRDDILVTHSGSNSFSESLPYPQYRKGICGSTRMLTATVTGAAGATVTSVVGESTKTHTIPAGGTLKLWHPATIPLDATSLTVSIDATTTDAKLLAV